MYARFSVTANLAIFSAGSDSAKHYSTGLTTAASFDPWALNVNY